MVNMVLSRIVIMLTRFCIFRTVQRTHAMQMITPAQEDISASVLSGYVMARRIVPQVMMRVRRIVKLSVQKILSCVVMSHALLNGYDVMASQNALMGQMKLIVVCLFPSVYSCKNSETV